MAEVSTAALRAEPTPPPTTDRPFRIIVTGARTVTVRQGLYIMNVLYLATLRPLAVGCDVVIVQGKCKTGGADLVAESWASLAKLRGEPFPADWQKYGKNAGPIRNQEMVNAGADICLAFPNADSVGTWDCVRKAAAAGIHVRIYPLTTEEPE